MVNEAAELIKLYLQDYGIQEWLDQDQVEDFAVQEPQVAWVRQAGKWFRVEMPQLTLEFLTDLAIVSAALTHDEFGTHKAAVDTDWPNGAREHVNGFPDVPLGTISHTVRKHEEVIHRIGTIPDRYIVAGWNQYDYDADPMLRAAHLDRLTDLYDDTACRGDRESVVHFLQECLLCRQNMLIGGATGSSKTTLLTTLSSGIPPWKRVITVEDAKELAFLHPNIVRLIFKRFEQGASSTAQYLLQCALRMHPDLIILGEARGAEAWDFVDDVTPTHPGSLIGVHANSPASALVRLMDLCKRSTAAASYDDAALARRVAASVDVIVPLEQIDGSFHFHPIWYIGAAMAHKKNGLHLLGEA